MWYPLSQLPSPCIKGDIITVHIVKEVYLVGIEEWKNNLHGHMLLTKWG